jgi:hypothetical protein
MEINKILGLSGARVPWLQDEKAEITARLAVSDRVVVFI